MAELLETELFFVFGLSEMRMEMHAVFARQFGGLLHQVRRHGKGRTGREHDLHHRAGSWVMILFDETLGIFEDGIFAIHNGIRRQSALGCAEGHRAARGVQAESDLVRGGNFVVQF